jgi:hypothetical protein
MIRIFHAQVSQRVVGNARQLWCQLGDEFKRRIGKRQHVLHTVEFVDQTQPRVDIEQRLDLRERGYDGVAGDKRSQTVKVNLRHEVVENIDLHPGILPHRLAGLPPL